MQFKQIIKHNEQKKKNIYFQIKSITKIKTSFIVIFFLLNGYCYILFLIFSLIIIFFGANLKLFKISLN